MMPGKGSPRHQRDYFFLPRWRGSRRDLVFFCFLLSRTGVCCSTHGPFCICSNRRRTSIVTRSSSSTVSVPLCRADTRRACNASCGFSPRTTTTQGNSNVLSSREERRQKEIGTDKDEYSLLPQNV